MKYLLILAFSLFSYSATLSENAQEGRETYIEAKCQQCHSLDSSFDTKKYKVKNHYDLRKWVSTCMTAFNHAWFPDEQANVVAYLNEIKYKIDVKKDKK